MIHQETHVIQKVNAAGLKKQLDAFISEGYKIDLVTQVDSFVDLGMGGAVCSYLITITKIS